MYNLAVLIGIYAYGVFAIGLAGFLYKNVIVFFTVVFFVLVLAYYIKRLKSWLAIGVINLLKIKEKLFWIIFLIFIFQAIVNLIGALGPELAFDSLWYHLVLPKLYLQNHAISYIPGNLLYYSAMPQLGEMLYILPLAFYSEIGAKLIHFTFGLLSCIAIYNLSRKFFSKELSILGVVLFYSNLVVGWESTTAFIDLVRTFFEIVAFSSMVDYFRTKKSSYIFVSGVILGFAIGTKLLAIGTLTIFIGLLVLYFFESKQKISKLIFSSSILTSSAIFSSLPWFVYAFVNTGNPFYPFFSSVLKLGVENDIINPLFFIKSFISLFLFSSDPIIPIYIISIPLLIIFFSKITSVKRYFIWFSILAFVYWYLLPKIGGGRFILPYLPVFGLVVLSVIYVCKNKILRVMLMYSIIFCAIISLGYRGIANARYIPVIFGFEKKEEFLSNNLNFEFGDYYDTDGYFKKHIVSKDKVLVYGVHNLFYVNFPFVHETWIKNGDWFNYILVQNSQLPERFSFWRKIYDNTKTHVSLYSVGKIWYY